MFSLHFQAAAGISVIIATAGALVYEHAPYIFTIFN